MLASRFLCTFLTSVAVAVAGAVSSHAASSPLAGVGILHSAPWSPGDSVRDGAGEFTVFLRTAQLQREHRATGLIAVGDRHGMLRSGGERALRRVVLTGVAVVKLAPGGEIADGGHEVFLNGGILDAAAASAVLLQCLERFGAPPAVIDPEKPTRAELAAIRRHLQPFQQALAFAAGNLVASR
jgi:hypothetical protein